MGEVSGAGRDPGELGHAWFPLDPGLERISTELNDLARAQRRLQLLMAAMLAISRELDLEVVLSRIVSAAVDVVGARYGALGVLDAKGEALGEFLTVGLDESEKERLAGTELPRGRGLLGYLIHHPEPLRVADIARHPDSVGFPPGHPKMRTLLGVAISVHQQVYGNLYLSERLDGNPFDESDEAMLVALAGAAGVAIENARLFERVRDRNEEFQRLFLPGLPDLRPVEAAAVYRPPVQPEHIGGDWYDAVLLPDGSCAAVVGDVAGHDLRAAASMAQTRSMLRALLYELRTPPSAVLSRLDTTQDAFEEHSVTTACLVRIETRGPDAWTLHWSTAGHPPPLLVTPDGHARYLAPEPDLPLGVDISERRHDHAHRLEPGSTVVLYTDGLVEHRDVPVDIGLRALAQLASANFHLPVDRFCSVIADQHPSDGHDDLAVLALRTPSD
ncbi:MULTISPECIES: PP2C family protein-serine/threonine phosphatase [unclassified Streptomyces]|uniref:PP2C family protein-serine/threonine phosphatase n=1 Tax=unclassified Streptomyces TaxID=2593676 RepID=UPI00382EEF14